MFRKLCSNSDTTKLTIMFQAIKKFLIRYLRNLQRTIFQWW